MSWIFARGVSVDSNEKSFEAVILSCPWSFHAVKKLILHFVLFTNHCWCHGWCNISLLLNKEFWVVRWRELPPMLHKRFPNLVGMVVDPVTRAYKIVVAGDYYEDNVRTEVYDSLSNCWRITGNHLPIANYTLRNAFCNGFHFWVTRDPYGVIAFNMQHGVWSVVRAPMPSFLTSPHLVGCQRRLLMVGGLKKHAIPKNIRIWELEQSTMNWVEVVRMPHTLCKRFLKDSRNGDFMCVGHNDLICLTSYKCPHALVYDFIKRSWRWVPSCPLLTDIEDYRSTIGFPFSPRLDSPV